MRKNVIALMLVLPLLFVFVVFTSGNASSLKVGIAANGIKILQNYDKTISIDMSNYDNEYEISAEVYPKNAANKNYHFEVRQVGDNQKAEISVENGKIIPRSVGLAKIVAVSEDGGFTDSVTVAVSSSKPYDFEFLLSHDGSEGKTDVEFKTTENGYEADVVSGSLDFKTKLLPSGYALPKIEVSKGFAEINRAAGKILLPFSGEVELSVMVEDGANGTIEKTIKLNVSKFESASGITIDGAASAVKEMENNAKSTHFYVETSGSSINLPESEDATFSAQKMNEIEQFEALGLSDSCYLVEVNFTPGHALVFAQDVESDGKSAQITFSFLDFAFKIRSEIEMQDEDRVIVYKGKKTTFYAVPLVNSDNIVFEWSVSGGSGVALSESDDGKTCDVTASEHGTLTLTCTPISADDETEFESLSLEIEVVEEVTLVEIQNQNEHGGLNDMVVIAGKKYTGANTLGQNAYTLNIVKHMGTLQSSDISGLKFSISDDSLADITLSNGKICLLPKENGGKGEVKVTVYWETNDKIFGTQTFYVDCGAVEVNNSPELFAQTEAGNPVVLSADIMLGTDASGTQLESNFLSHQKEIKSTYNTKFYENAGRKAEAVVKVVMEFKNNVYGNGFSINAHNYTTMADNEVQGNIIPTNFKGPLDFVQMTGVASVAGQDNIAFLIRTKGVTLFNVQLMSCKDTFLNVNDDGTGDENGTHQDLKRLNSVGTTLEINASANIINCRISNGRNLVRAYGGNTNGDNYFVSSLTGEEISENERIHVNIQGCVLSMAREFILKLGANRALAGYDGTTNMGPALTLPDASNTEQPISYNSDGVSTDEDSLFYKRYVMTDVNLEDSILQTSGLFAVGIESNFAGMMLGNIGISGGGLENWTDVAGTSFASVLRLKGNVRIYDWKDLGMVDSSTLIQNLMSDEFEGNKSFLKLDINEMLKFVKSKGTYDDIITNSDGVDLVHGGIALYGGGRNYSQVDFSGLATARDEFNEYLINIKILADSEDETLQQQGTALPLAAGGEDFRFYLYGSGSSNNLFNSTKNSVVNKFNLSGKIIGENQAN